MIYPHDPAGAARVLRDRMAAMDEDRDRAASLRPPAGNARVLLSVYDGGAMPSTGDHYFLGHPVALGGAETEGGTGAPVIDTATSVPFIAIRNPFQVGDLVVATACGGRWVAEKGGCADVTFHVTCSAASVTGATVTVSDSGGQVASGTTDSTGAVSLRIPGSGTYTVTATGGTCTETYTATMALTCGNSYALDCCCSVTVCVTACPTGAIVGATVTVKDATSGATIATCTTAAGGCCTLSIPAAGSYSVSAAASGYQTFTSTRNLACGGQVFIPLQTTGIDSDWQFYVSGCCNKGQPSAGNVTQPQPLAGATVTVTGPDGDTRTATTDANGFAGFPITKAGSYSGTVAADRFTTVTVGPQTFPDCPNSPTVGFQQPLSPAPGYYCTGPDSTGYYPANPAPATLHLTDTVTGGCTLTYQAGQDPSYWEGSITYNYPGSANCGCPAVPLTVTYTLYDCGNSGQLGVSWGTCDIGTCLSGAFFKSGTCPHDPPVPAQSCVGKPDNTQILNNCGPNGSATAGNTTIAHTVPFDFTGTIPANTSCTSLYPNGATITITE